MAKILLVDDSRLSRSMEGDALRLAGHDVSEAIHGVDGFEQFQQGAFDLVVTDLLMPVCDGVEFLRRLRVSGSTTPVIICSADIQESTRRICDELGISAFLNKPVRGEQLAQCVAHTLANLAGVAP